MTIDEAIKHCEEVAELNEECTRIYDEHGRTMESFSCKECAVEHRQLAEWLRELKAYREAIPKVMKEIRNHRMCINWLDAPNQHVVEIEVVEKILKELMKDEID